MIGQLRPPAPAAAAGGASPPCSRPRLDRQLLSPQPSTPSCPLVDRCHDTPEYHVPDKPHSTTMAAVAQMPAGATHTHLQSMKRTFNNVPVGADNAISTEEFLDAAESLTTMFGTRPAPFSVSSDLPRADHANQTSSAPSPSPLSRRTCWATSRYGCRTHCPFSCVPSRN
jgi:hypothetical protein